MGSSVCVCVPKKVSISTELRNFKCFLSSMMNILNLQLCKHLSSVSLPMSLPFAQEETSSGTILYWLQLTNVRISVTQNLHFFHICLFLNFPYSNSPS